MSFGLAFPGTFIPHLIETPKAERVGEVRGKVPKRTPKSARPYRGLRGQCGGQSACYAIAPAVTHMEPFNRTNMDSAEQYDFVIIGAGSAGRILANRLSADSRTRVLLLEAGGEELDLDEGPVRLLPYDRQSGL